MRDFAEPLVFVPARSEQDFHLAGVVELELWRKSAARAARLPSTATPCLRGSRRPARRCPKSRARGLGGGSGGRVAGACRVVDRAPVDALCREQLARRLAYLVQQVIEVGVALEGGEQDERLRAQPAGDGIPAGELDGGGAFPLSSVGVQEDDAVLVEGAVEREDRLVASDEALLGDVTQQQAVELDGIEFRLLAQRGRRPGGAQLDGRGFVGDGDEPVLQRPWLEADPALGIEPEMLAPLGGGLAEAAPAGQRGVELPDVLRGGDDVDAVAHPEDGGDALVNDFLGERADGADFVVDVAGRLRRGGGFVHRGLAGVEHQDGHAVIVEKLAECLAVHGAHLVLAGVLEEEIAVLACVLAAEREAGERAEPVGELRLAQVGIDAVAVEVDDVKGPAGRLGVGELFLQALERGRAERLDVEAGAVCAEVLQEAIGHGAQFDILRAARPARDVEEPDAAVIAGGTGTKEMLGFDWTRTNALTRREMGESISGSRISSQGMEAASATPVVISTRRSARSLRMENQRACVSPLAARTLV